jgi:hypothetical protein
MEHFQPEVELSPVNWVEISCDFKPGVEMLYVPGIDSLK